MDTTEKQIRDMFCNSGPFDRDEIALLMLQLVERIQNLEQALQQQQLTNEAKPLTSEVITLTNEVIKLRGEISVLVGLLGAALQVIETVDGDDYAESQMLMELQNKITYAIRAAHGIKGDA